MSGECAHVFFLRNRNTKIATRENNSKLVQVLNNERDLLLIKTYVNET